MKRPGPRRKSLTLSGVSEAERAQFRAAVADVQPLPDRHRRVEPPAAPAYAQLRSERQRANRAASQAVPGRRQGAGGAASLEAPFQDGGWPHEEAVGDPDPYPDLIAGGRVQECTTSAGQPALLHADAAHALLRDLQRGRWAVEARLDLHGCHQELAQQRLLALLRRAREEGWRCLLIIHGRGRRSAAPGGVLRELVWQFLRHRPEVLACCPAPAPLGGEGALLLRLRAAHCLTQGGHMG